MPYRPITLPAENGAAETHWVRVDDRAVAEWLPERARLRHRGYPDRPPDIDTPTLRAWLPRPGEQAGEQALRGFRDRATRVESDESGIIFPILTMTWHRAGGATTKVIFTGFGDGSFVSRVVIVNSSGDCPVDQAHRLAPEVDPDRVSAEVETIVRAINEAPMGWEPRDPMVTDYGDFLDLDGEVETAEAEARAAGLLAPEWVQ
jgi:hypothetical protein